MAEEKTALIKPLYRPSVERQKQRYWAERRRKQMLERLRGGRPSAEPNRKPIPDNSVPWLDRPARNLSELVEVMRQMESCARTWKLDLSSS